MATRSFSVGEMIKTGWAKFKEEPLTWILALLFFALIWGSHPFVSYWITQGEEDYSNPGILSVLISAIYALVDLGLTLGLVYMGIRVADNQPIHVGHLFSRFHYVFHYLIAKFLFSLILLAGMILLLFPAAIWGTRYGLFPLFIADKGAGPIQALKMSAEATMGAKWDLLAFYLVSMCLLLVGVVAAVVGLLVVLPPLYVAWGYIYRRLTSPLTEPVAIAPDFSRPSSSSLSGT